MRVIALDSTTRAGSVALVEDDCVIDERAGDASRSHAEWLPGEIVDLAAAHGVALAEVDLFAVASGPGSFTGLRIGIANRGRFELFQPAVRRRFRVADAIKRREHVAPMRVHPRGDDRSCRRLTTLRAGERVER